METIYEQKAINKKNEALDDVAIFLEVALENMPPNTSEESKIGIDMLLTKVKHARGL